MERKGMKSQRYVDKRKEERRCWGKCDLRGKLKGEEWEGKRGEGKGGKGERRESKGK